MKKHNFNAGPSMLPKEILQKVSESILDYNKNGLSLIEISHRSSEFVSIMEEARFLVLELLNLQNQGYQVLFLQGGASMEFLRIPYNLLKNDGKSSYLDTGNWSWQAIKQAQFFGKTQIVASSKDENYSYIPKKYSIDSDSDYFHCTSNNTIYGTQINDFPDFDIPLVCDMSSDIFSRKLDFSKFDLIYAGTQKNIGTAGVSLIVVKEKILKNTQKTIPDILNYKTHIERKSMYNTPNVFAVYVSLLTLKWIQDKGGISILEKQNNTKAILLYEEIDRNSMFYGTAKVENRSKMNATFRLYDSSHQEKFDNLCKNAGISGLEGHRIVGGYRASIYNAMPIESVQVLVEVMKEFENIAQNI